jgi:hypothetical protein
MVGHCLKRIQHQRLEPPRQCIPDSLNNAPLLGQFHFTLYDLAEKEFPVLGADGDKIRAAASVVVSAQTNGPSMMNARIVGHISRSPMAASTIVHFRGPVAPWRS